jgi:glycosyltransferase involved in cell wall biosynthesis
VRLAVYTDYVYRRQGETIFTERAFSLFLAALADRVDRLLIAGRLDPTPGTWHYEVPAAIDFAPLPHYPSLAHPLAVARAVGGSLRAFWRALDDVDHVWLLGPHPIALCFAGLATVRGRQIALGVRQDLPTYVRSRHPGRVSMRFAAALMETLYRLLGRVVPVVVVGPELAERYRRSRRLLELTVSLVDERDVAPPETASERDYTGRLTALSVGRLDAEKNPLLLAEVLALLHRDDPRWQMAVYGDGPLREQLAERLTTLGLEGHAELHGYVPLDAGLLDAYRASHAFLHVSWTEGLPQVLFEAFAARLPVVATEVGGVPRAVGDAALLVPPGDASLAGNALARVANDAELRDTLIERGVARVREHTLGAESERLRRFLEAREAGPSATV